MRAFPTYAIMTTHQHDYRFTSDEEVERGYATRFTCTEPGCGWVRIVLTVEGPPGTQVKSATEVPRRRRVPTAKQA